MKFKDLVDNMTLENKIKFQRQMIEIQKKDLAENGDDGFGRKERRLKNMYEDLKRLEDEYKKSHKR